MTDVIKQRYASGVARHLTGVLPTPPRGRVAVVLVGASPGFLGRVLASGVLRRAQARTVLAPPRLAAAGAGAPAVRNPLLDELPALREAGLVSRVVADEAKLGEAESVLLDLTGAAERVLGLRGLTPARRHAAILAALAALAPRGAYDAVLTLVEPGLSSRPVLDRLRTVLALETAEDHVVFAAGAGLLGPVLRDPSLLFLLDAGTRLAVRLDEADRRTAGRARMGSAASAFSEAVAKALPAPALPEGAPDDADQPGTAAALPVRADQAGPRPGDSADSGPRRPPPAPGGSVPRGGPPAPAAGAGSGNLGGAAGAGPPPSPVDALLLGRAAPDHERRASGEAEWEALPAAPAEPPSPGAAKAAETAARLRRELPAAPFTAHDGRATTLGAVLAGPAHSPLRVQAAPGRFLDPEVARPVFDAISKSYLSEGHLDRDLASVLASLADDPDVPIFVRGVTREPSSDTLNNQDLLSVELQDSRGRRSTLRVDVPAFDRDGYLFLNGVKWSITKQLLAKPVIKVRPDTVLITTAYNKATVERFGASASPRSGAVRWLASRLARDRVPGVEVELGSAAGQNAGRDAAFEFADVARSVRSLRTAAAAFVFSLPALEAEVAARFPWAPAQLAALPAGSHPLGYERTLPADAAAVWAITPDGTVTALHKGREPEPAPPLDQLVGEAVRAAAPSDAALYAPSSGGRRFAHSRVKLLSQYLPTAVLVGHELGLEPMLRRAGVDHELLDPAAARRAPREGRDSVRFQDAVLSYSTARLRDSLLLNGLKDVETGGRPVADFAAGGPGWTDYVADRLGSPGHVKALKNYRVAFLDPTTRELLRADGLPDDLPGLLLHCSALLETDQHREANDLASYRLRGPELVPALLYKILHKEMERVRATRESALPQRLAVSQGELMRQVLASSNVEAVSDLNPLLEAEQRSKASWTGAAGGLSGGRTVNRAMRAYHPSMLGVFGFYSPDNAEIGVKRALALGTAVVDTRGRLSSERPGGAARRLSLNELMSPFTAQHDDPPRTGMQSKQGTHTLPTKHHTPLLVGSGAERTLAHALGNTFAYKARAAGVVTSVDSEHELAQLRHADGTTSAIDLAARSVKNSGGGRPRHVAS